MKSLLLTIIFICTQAAANDDLISRDQLPPINPDIASSLMPREPNYEALAIKEIQNHMAMMFGLTDTNELEKSPLIDNVIFAQVNNVVCRAELNEKIKEFHCPSSKEVLQAKEPSGVPCKSGPSIEVECRKLID